MTDFVKGFNQFYHQYSDSSAMEKHNGCVKLIVRVKNDFVNIDDECSSLPLNLFNYCDIKCNVLLEYNKTRLIGEIQFILSFMVCDMVFALF